MVNVQPDRCVVALDVGGTSVKSAPVAEEGHLVVQPKTTPIDSEAPAEVILQSLADIVESHIGELDTGSHQLLGVALGFPGPFEYEAGISRIQGVVKFESLYGLNVREGLQRHLQAPNLPIRFRNDAEAAIVGEARYGAGRPYQRLIGLTLGTGCGSAFLVKGKRVNSGRGVPADGWLYPVLFHGERADDVFSKRGLEARLQAAEVTPVEIKGAAIAARRGEAAVRHVFETFGADLGEFLALFVVDFRAEAVLVLGGIAGAFDLFGPPLQQALPVPVLPGERGADAALLGAAELLFAESEMNPK